MAVWWSYRKEVIDPIVADHGGRVVKVMGDGFLAEFDTSRFCKIVNDRQ